MAQPQVVVGGEDFQMWRLAANTLNKEQRTDNRCLGFDERLITPLLKKLTCYKILYKASEMDRS